MATVLSLDELKRENARLRDSEERYRTLFDTLDEGMAVVEMIYDGDREIVDMVVRHVNGAYERHSGIYNVVGRSVVEMLPGVENVWLDRYKRVASTGEPIRVEDYQQDVDRWFDVFFTRVDETGHFVAIVFRDITERKRAEAALHQGAERQAFLLKLSDILQRLDQPDHMKSASTHLLGERLGVSRAQYHEVDDSGEYYGADGIGYADGLPLLDLKYRIDQFGSFVAEDFEAGRPFRSADLSADPRATAEEREAYGLYQIRSGAGIPLLRGGKLVAILALHDMRPRAWTDLEMELIRETAERIWIAVEKVRTERAVREAVERQTFLLTLSDALRAERSEDGVATRAIRMLFAQLQLDRCYLADYQLADDRADITHQVRSDGLASMPETIRLSDFPEAFRAVFDRTLVIGDVLADESLSHPDRKNILGLGIRALMAPTLRKGAQRPLWVIVAASARPRHWTLAEIALVEEAAERTWAALERARAEVALRESEERFQQFAASSADALWIRDAATLEMEYVSPAIQAIYGIPPDAILNGPERWAALIVPEDRDAALAHLEQARAGEVTVHEFRIQRPSDGTFRWIRDTDFPLHDAHGQVQRIGGIAEDVTETKLAVEHTAVLLAELQHRVRNIMAVIRAITARTGERAESVPEYAAAMAGRLLTLARVQALLTRTANAGVGIVSIVRDELDAQVQYDGQYTLDGSDLALSPKAAEVLTLVIHELTTNALKYGALSAPQGHIMVAWATFERRGASWLGLDWTEAGAPERPLPDRSVPRRRGFGSELIEGRVPYELGGRGKVVIEPCGARCRLEFPLRDGASILETDAPKRALVFGGALDMTGEADLSGRRVLVVEDDYYLATDTARALQGAGAEVLGPCPTEDAAHDEIEEQCPDAAIIDINLGGGPSFKLAETLKALGIPFMFITGYDLETIPNEFDSVERLQKPVQLRQVVAGVAKLLT